MDGTGIAWFVEHTPVASVLFVLAVAVIGLFAVMWRHERKCERTREKDATAAAEFRKEVRGEFRELRDEQAHQGQTLGRIEGRLGITDPG